MNASASAEVASGNDNDGGWGGEEEVWSSSAKNATTELESPVTVSITPCSDLVASSNSSEESVVNVAVCVTVPERVARSPIDVCCVVDVSGSMDDLARYEDEDGKEKCDGLTMLDIAKHAVKVVMMMLTAEDRLTIVSFEDGAKVIFALGEMNGGGREQAMVALEQLQAGGGTNLWAGLVSGMDALRTSTLDTTRKKTLLLLTDGQPSVNPPKGYIPEFRQYKEMHPDFLCQVNSFG